MKVLFMGTPAVAVPVLSALVDEGYDLVEVISQPDRAAGRGRQIAPTPIKEYALNKGLKLLQPSSLNAQSNAQAHIVDLRPDVIVVAAYGRLLPPTLLGTASIGCLNVHPSLLPKYRGPSPVTAAILNGDKSTGTSVIEMSEQMDSGPVVAQATTSIGSGETAGVLTARLFQMAAGLIIELLPKWSSGKIVAKPQDDYAATTTPLLSKEDGRIDWSQSANDIALQIRAYDPWPGTFTYWGNRRLKILEGVEVSDGRHICDDVGSVVGLSNDSMGVVTGRGILELVLLQLEGRRSVEIRDFLQGNIKFQGAQLT